MAHLSGIASKKSIQNKRVPLKGPQIEIFSGFMKTRYYMFRRILGEDKR